MALARFFPIFLCISATASAQGFSLLGADPWARHKLSTTFESETFPKINVDVCRNSTAFALVVIAPKDGELDGDKVSLRLEFDTQIDGVTCVFHPMGFVVAEDETNVGMERYADVIERPTDSFLIRGAKPTMVWLKFHVNKDTMPGTYAGRLVASSGLFSTQLPVQIIVHDVALPDPVNFSLRLIIWQEPLRWAAEYGIEPWSDAHWRLIESCLRDLAAHGAQSVLSGFNMHMIHWTKKADGTWAFDFSLWDRYVELASAVGINGPIEYQYVFSTWHESTIEYFDEQLGKKAYVKAWPTDPEWLEPTRAFLAAFFAHVEEKGWLDRFYIAPADEPNDMYTGRCLADYERMVALIRSINPRINIFTDFEQFDIASRYAQYPDRIQIKFCWWVYSADLVSQLKKLGKEVDLYVCVHPDKPNTFIWSPPREAIILPWLAFREQVQGLQRWAYANWTNDTRLDPIGHDFNHLRNLPAGDRFLVYPDTQEPGILSSPRWEGILQGAQDYELLSMLEQLIEQTKTLNREEADVAQTILNEAILQVAGPSPYIAEYTQNSEILRQARQRVLVQIVALRKNIR